VVSLPRTDALGVLAMLELQVLGRLTAMRPSVERPGSESITQVDNPVRPSITQSVSDPIPLSTYPRLIDDSTTEDESSSDESRDIVDDTTLLPMLSRPMHARLPEERNSYSTVDESPPCSRSSSLRCPSSVTSPSVYTVESLTAYTTAALCSRPSVLHRLRSSVSATSSSKPTVRRPSVQPTEFRMPPEQPERRFVDSIGVVCPGVIDRSQCAHPLAHFVSSFRMCQPIEYTTALADHGLTDSDYRRLLAALSNFLDRHAAESDTNAPLEMLSSTPGERQPVFGSEKSVAKRKQHASTFFDTTKQLGKAKRRAAALNQMLEDITSNLRGRGLSVAVSVSSFSLFAPHHISEAHVQILHAPLELQHQPVSVTPNARSGQRLSFIDPFSFVMAEPRSVSKSRPKLEGRSQSEVATQDLKHHHQTSQNRDRSRPWPLWPNAIPSRERQVMNDNADRYGVDPYFRAWMRANINSRTKSSTYAKYMIEQEDNPFINRRLEYDASPRAILLWDVMTRGPTAWRHQFLSSVNRAKYDHNRKLECRRTIEHGSRLRILRFGFRHAIYPPHTPEMEALGLSETDYQTVISNIADIHTNTQLFIKCPVSYMLASWNRIRRRSTEDALLKVSEYMRGLNALQRRVVWTIEKIPGVYDRGLARDWSEWEISAWNGEDPLELLIQLERWGLIEQRLSVEEEE
jgi:hypothetical protein